MKPLQAMRVRMHNVFLRLISKQIRRNMLHMLTNNFSRLPMHYFVIIDRIVFKAITPKIKNTYVMVIAILQEVAILSNSFPFSSTKLSPWLKVVHRY